MQACIMSEWSLLSFKMHYFSEKVEGAWIGKVEHGRCKIYSQKRNRISTICKSLAASSTHCHKQSSMQEEGRFVGGVLRPRRHPGDAHKICGCFKKTNIDVEVGTEFGGGSGGGGDCGGFSGGGDDDPCLGGDGDENDGEKGFSKSKWLTLTLSLKIWLGRFGKTTSLAFVGPLVAFGGRVLLLNHLEGSGAASALQLPFVDEVSGENLVEPQKGQNSSIWEIKGGQWTRFFIDRETDSFVPEVTKGSEEEAMCYESSHPEFKLASSSEDGHVPSKSLDLIQYVNASMAYGLEIFKQLMLPEGYPKSVTADYTEYTIWRMGQIIASQISGVFTTQALLYAVGLGKGAIPAAAAVNWVLRDGIGYLSKIVLSKYGRHFDVHPKGWRLLSDILENISNGLDLLTPIFPHLFVFLGALAGAGRSAAGLIQAATRSCFYAGFAAQHNYAEVIAKGEAQGMVSKFVGIALGLGISSHVGASGSLLVVTFVGVTIFHVVCNLKSYQAVQLHTLNTYRASLLMLGYLQSGKVLSVKEVNAQEPIFPHRYFAKIKVMDGQMRNQCQLQEVKNIAVDIEQNLELGLRLKNLVKTKSDVLALFELYRNEQYIMFPMEGRYKVVLKEAASPQDMLRVVLQISYMYYNKTPVERASIHEWSDLERSYNLMQENFEMIKQNLEMAGWVADGLIARSGSHRLLNLSASDTEERSTTKRRVGVMSSPWS